MTATTNCDADLHLADVLSAEIERTPQSELLAETAADFGDRRALAREFDQVLARAVAETRRRRFLHRLQELAAQAWAFTALRPVGSAVAALALLIVAGTGYFAVDRWRAGTEIARQHAALEAARKRSVEEEYRVALEAEQKRRADEALARVAKAPDGLGTIERPSLWKKDPAADEEAARREAEKQRMAVAEQEQARMRAEREAEQKRRLASRNAVPPADWSNPDQLFKQLTGEVWSLETGQVVAVLGGNGEAVASCTFSADGTRLATVSDRVVRLWNAQTGYGITELRHDAHVVAMAFSPDGRQIATITDGALRIWDGGGRLTTTVTIPAESKLLSLALTPDGRQLAVALSDNTVRLLAVRSSENTMLLPAWSSASTVRLPGPATHMAFSPDGALLATASDDTKVNIWDFRTGNLVRALAREPIPIPIGQSGLIVSIAFSPDGRRIIAGSTDRTAYVWDAATGAQLVRISGHAAPVVQAQFDPDGTSVITASSDGTSRIWNAETGAVVATLTGHRGPVTGAGFSPDGRLVATTSQDGTTRLWRVRAAKQ